MTTTENPVQQYYPLPSEEEIQRGLTASKDSTSTKFGEQGRMAQLKDEGYREVELEGYVPGYWVDKNAQVLSPRGTLLAHTKINNHLYVAVKVTRGNFSSSVRVDRIVLTAFEGESDDPLRSYPIHADGDMFNCALSNLRWGTLEEAKANGSTTRALPHGDSLRRKRKSRTKTVSAPEEIEVTRVYRMGTISATVDINGNGKLSKVNLSPPEWEALAHIAARVVEMNKMMGL